jgi:hypothetical protein
MFQRNISPPFSGSKSKPRKKPAESADKYFLIGLVFDLEDGGDMFFRNIVLSSKYTALNPETDRFLQNTD